MGEVFRARDTRLHRDVAIKFLPAAFTTDRDRVQRFEREARLLAAVNCPNIASIYGVEEVDGAMGLVLELVEGDTLADKLSRVGADPRVGPRGGHMGPPLRVDEALAIARQIVDALDAAHERGIVHRDLKPANIKITPDGVVKVLDFGLAKGGDEVPAPDLSHSPTVTAHGTEAGVILGTAAYMSPEQARGLQVDKRTDIWAFGCVLYEMLTGRRAFDGATASDIVAAILRSDPDWSALPAATPPVVRRLLSRLLEKDPKRRLRDIADVRFEIDDAASAGSEPPVHAVGDRSARGWRWIAVASLAAAIAMLAFIIVGLRRTPPIADSPLASIVVSQLTSYDGTEAAAAISPDGRSFAFVSNHGGTSDIWLRQVAGGEPVRLTNDAASESDLVYAANGEAIYFTRAERGETAIWRIGALGGEPRKVLNNAQCPAPSPDLRRLAWFSVEPGGGYSLNVGGDDGSNKRILVTNVLITGALTAATWSRDGRRVAYSSGGLFAPRNLFVVDVDAGQVRQVTRQTRGGVQAQAWLADNRHVIASYLSPDHMFISELGIIDVETGTLTRTTMNISESFGVPSVSSDGSRIVVVATRTEREVWRVPLGPDPDANGRAATRLVDTSQDPMWTFVSRDGRTLLFNNALAGSRNLWTVPIDGSARPRQITTVPGEAVMHSSLSPDGTYTAFVSSMTGNSDLWVQHVDGSDLRQLTKDAAAEAWPIWSPDGKSIAFQSLRDGVNQYETRRVAAAGGPAEKIVDGFFRGDWIAKPDGAGSLLVTSMVPAGLRLIDFDTRAVLWQDRHPGNAMPSFSPDGRLVSIAYRESRDRDTIWVYDTASGKGRVAVRFPEPFTTLFRASWIDDGKAFAVNRNRLISHVVMLDRFGGTGASR
jgi:Tol biopolymer transport system component